MSGFIGGLLGSAAGQTASKLEQVLFRTPRAIGMIIPDVVLEEHHHDELVITEHPVEQGAAITDHAYKRPAEVTMRCGWSNSSQFNLLSLLGVGSENYVREIYQNIIDLQNARVPILVMTGKRLYQNMLVQSVSMETIAATEYSLICTIRLKQIRLVTLQSAQVQSSPQADQAQPQNTNPTSNAGTVQAVPSPIQGTPATSLLLSGAGLLVGGV